MGLIKALTSSTSSVLGDQFKEFIECPQVDNNVIIQRGIVKHGVGNEKYSEGIISNGSTIAVPQGMAMMIVDNGKIVEFTAEPGTYTWDTSTEPSIFTGGLGKGLIESIKTLGNRITYGGQEAKDQRVYFVNIKTIPGQLFGSTEPETVFDPVYGSVQITYNGEYAIRVDDPIILINKIVGTTPRDTLTYDDIFKSDDGKNMLKGRFSQKISEAISNIMVLHNVSFNRIQPYKSDITDQMNKILDDEWHQKYGIIVEDVTLRINASESSQKIIQDMDAEIARTTRMGEVYSSNLTGTMAAASAEAMKTAAGNDAGSMMGLMGMNMANITGNTMMNAVTQNNVFSEGNKKESNIPTPGTIFKNEETSNTNTLKEEVKTEESTSTKEVSKSENTVENVTTSTQTLKFCPNCGAPTSGGNFCGQCGNKLK